MKIYWENSSDRKNKRNIEELRNYEFLKFFSQGLLESVSKQILGVIDTAKVTRFSTKYHITSSLSENVNLKATGESLKEAYTNLIIKTLEITLKNRAASYIDKKDAV